LLSVSFDSSEALEDLLFCLRRSRDAKDRKDDLRRAN